MSKLKNLTLSSMYLTLYENYCNCGTDMKIQIVDTINLRYVCSFHISQFVGFCNDFSYSWERFKEYLDAYDLAYDEKLIGYDIVKPSRTLCTIFI